MAWAEAPQLSFVHSLATVERVTQFWQAMLRVYKEAHEGQWTRMSKASQVGVGIPYKCQLKRQHLPRTLLWGSAATK